MPRAKNLQEAARVLIHYIRQAGGGRLSADAAAELDDAELAFAQADETIARLGALIEPRPAPPSIFERYPAPWQLDASGSEIFDAQDGHVATLSDAEVDVGDFIVDSVNLRAAGGSR